MSATEPIRMLGRYELLRRIAKGGMGEIYLARTRGMAGFEKNCIIKTILPHLAEEEEFVTKFLDEGRIVVQLVHGNIVPVFDMGDEAGEVFMAMEYIAGRDLREVTKRLAGRGETMPVDLALFVVSEVCKGLDYAHRKADESGESLGIVHRDVSPSNVLISREGEVKLIDFGIARAAGRLGKTVSGRIQGKFCYMSPEQAAGKSLDGRSDTFSAGLVLYELLTGFRPFEGGTDLESLDLVRQCEFDPPGALNLSVPAEIDEIVSGALAKDPDDRYPSIDKFQIALMQYLYSSGSSPTSSDLASFLGDLFPEGLEREELRTARDSSGSPAKKMSLDEALDFELGKLGGNGSTTEIDPHETTAVSSDQMRMDSKPSTQTRSPQTPEPTEVAPVEPEVETASTPAETPRRTGVVWAIVVTLVLGAGAVFAFSASSKGKRTINSDPPGAQISVDGALIPGAVTPHTLTLDEGKHEITLELEGYESRKVALSVDGGTKKTVEITKLRENTEAQGPKNFALKAEPEHAEFFLPGGAALGRPVVTVMPGAVVNVEARAEGCQSMVKQVEYGQANSGVFFTLVCDAPESDAGQLVEPAPERTITIDSDPSGASLTVNGKTLGTTPVKWTGPGDAMLRIRAKKDDRIADVQTNVARLSRDRFTVKFKARQAPPGCLIMSIINPGIAVWHLDGDKIGRDRGYSRKLPSGRHKVRVVNESMKLDYETSVDVKPGDNCTMLKLDGRDLNKPR